jgi:EF-P beta-lysylation protein EpmB
MIHRTAAAWQDITQKEQQLIASDGQQTKNNWQQQLQQAITDPANLLAILALDTAYLPAATAAAALFPLKVPMAFVDRMTKGDINDPLLKQVLPIGAECTITDGYSSDPVEEQAGSQPGIIHKYYGRLLLMVNGHCAINCRYCFRRHFPYDEHKLSREEWKNAIEHIKADTSISEIIYSGGDPLASGDKQLRWLTQEIAAIPHVKRLRIHSRLPVVIPDRITDECLKWMSQTRLSTVMVLHINHSQELMSATLKTAISRMRNTGITVLNQAVLLKGVNDTLDAQVELSDALFDAGVLPYYLHVLDKVQGSAHFDTADNAAKQLHHAMTARLPGYLVPKLVREVSNKPSKIAI